MTIEEKLAKAVAFIKSIEKLDKHNYDTFDLNDIENAATGECCECDSTDINIHLRWPNDITLNTEYIDYRILDDLSDRAWHVLADLGELTNNK